MPIIQINLLEGRSVEQKRAAVEGITAAVVKSFGVRPDQVRIMINEMPSEHFAIAGQTAAMRAVAAAPAELVKENR